MRLSSVQLYTLLTRRAREVSQAALARPVGSAGVLVAERLMDRSVVFFGHSVVLVASRYNQ